MICCDDTMVLVEDEWICTKCSAVWKPRSTALKRPDPPAGPPNVVESFDIGWSRPLSVGLGAMGWIVALFLGLMPIPVAPTPRYVNYDPDTSWYADATGCYPNLDQDGWYIECPAEAEPIEIPFSTDAQRCFWSFGHQDCLMCGPSFRCIE